MSTARGRYYASYINKQHLQMKGVNYINSDNKRNKHSNSNSNNQQRRTNTSTSYTHTRNDNKRVSKKAMSSYGRCSYSYNDNGNKMHQPHTTRVNKSCYLNLYTTRTHTRNACDTPREIEKCKSYRQVTPQYASKWHLNKQLMRCSRSTTQPIRQSRSYCCNNKSNCGSYSDKYKLNTYRNYYINTYKCCKNGKESSPRNSNLNTTLSKGGEGFTVEGYKSKIDTIEELHFYYVYVIQNGNKH